MGFFGRMLGIEDDSDRARTRAAQAPRGPAPNSEEQALERYRYMLRTAPPETLEEAHAEAFAKLSPEQRRTVAAQLAEAAPASEKSTVAATSPEDPQALARVATRAEIRQPGVLERTLGGGAMGVGGGLLASFAMGFVGSMVAQSFLSAIGGMGGGADPSADNAAPNEEALASNGEEESLVDDGGDFDDFDV